MGRRFSQRQLFEIRNHIPIGSVIEGLLDMPAKTVEGVFRFLCPQCGEFDTSIKPQTNLARCFRCEKNFNPIDMVMVVRRMEFVETVDMLLEFKKAMIPFESLPSRGDNGPPGDHSSAAGKSRAPSAIGDVLAQLTDCIIIGDARNHEKENPGNPRTLLDEIAELERIVDVLFQMI